MRLGSNRGTHQAYYLSLPKCDGKISTMRIFDLIAVAVLLLGTAALTALAYRGDTRAPAAAKSFVRFVAGPIGGLLLSWKMYAVAVPIRALQGALSVKPGSSLEASADTIQALIAWLTLPNFVSVAAALLVVAYALEEIPRITRSKTRVE